MEVIKRYVDRGDLGDFLDNIITFYELIKKSKPNSQSFFITVDGEVINTAMCVEIKLDY